jgi:hypothetical protein
VGDLAVDRREDAARAQRGRRDPSEAEERVAPGKRRLVARIVVVDHGFSSRSGSVMVRFIVPVPLITAMKPRRAGAAL